MTETLLYDDHNQPVSYRIVVLRPAGMGAVIMYSTVQIEQPQSGRPEPIVSQAAAHWEENNSAFLGSPVGLATVFDFTHGAHASSVEEPLPSRRLRRRRRQMRPPEAGCGFLPFPCLQLERALADSSLSRDGCVTAPFAGDGRLISPAVCPIYLADPAGGFGAKLGKQPVSKPESDETLADRESLSVENVIRQREPAPDLVLGHHAQYLDDARNESTRERCIMAYRLGLDRKFISRTASRTGIGDPVCLAMCRRELEGRT
ncbi:hypothetical protein FZEAL_9535 [Fusarium zealandicum]|uniref:Uncharacterized protein n=1 Tax=Fusarium zealandicum TaxID=1053134 RepID=A0A8H4XF31_9HYPO|nr:hypothetical protein FZEAL_9535 [Fusarium zealandicum]